MDSAHLSTTEYAVLGVLAEEPSHGFALSKELGPQSEVGRIFTVHRPLVYRALDRLAESGYAQAVTTEKGDSGPQRVVFRVTPRGRRRLDRWLAEPVDHVRDLRLQFLLKLALHDRNGRSPLGLIQDQRAALENTLRALEHESARGHDPVELWRRHNAVAAAGFLDSVEQLYQEHQTTGGRSRTQQ
ncbi:MAG TPA: PadR family transcriptional regulator [Acidimicrobiia bacterium]|nr:PadR family transcriptional regulator [Acidimicrobiia bacterium]